MLRLFFLQAFSYHVGESIRDGDCEKGGQKVIISVAAVLVRVAAVLIRVAAVVPGVWRRYWLVDMRVSLNRYAGESKSIRG